MSETEEQEKYEALRRRRPDLFVEREPDCYPLVPGGAVKAENEHLLLLDDRVRSPSGQLTSYLRVASPSSGAPGAAILPIAGQAVVLLDHPRHAFGRRLLEIPRGFGEPGETADECARRELKEELGVSPSRLHPLGVVHPDSGLLTTEVALFAAEVNVDRLKTEVGVNSLVMTVEEAEAAIRDGRVADSFTIACFYRARLRSLV